MRPPEEEPYGGMLLLFRDLLGGVSWWSEPKPSAEQAEPADGPSSLSLSLDLYRQQMPMLDGKGLGIPGNLPGGQHALSVTVIGKLPTGKDYHQTEQFTFEKSVGPRLLGIALAGPGAGQAAIALSDW